MLVAAAALWWTRASWYGVTVDVVTPRSDALAVTVVSSGRVMAPAELRLGSTIGGLVETVTVREGDRVVAGQVLVTLDATEAEASVARSEAALVSVAVRRQALEAMLAPTAREALRQARASLAQAERDAERDRQLVAKGAKTKAEAERTELALTLAQSRNRQARLDATDAGSKGSEVAAIDAAETEARAALEFAQARLALTQVVTPAPGIVLTRSVEPGEAVQPGAPLIIVARDGPQQVVIEPDEKNLKQLSLAQGAVVAADAYPEQRFTASVSWIAPNVDRRRGTIEVRLDVSKPEALLKPDMTVSVEIEVAREAVALTLPRAAVRDLASERPWVLVVDGARSAHRDVEVGLRGEDAVQIRSGLTAQDLVIPPTSGGPGVGAKVRVRAAEGA